MPVRLRFELPRLLLELLPASFEVSSAPPVLVERHHAGEVGVRQTLELLPQTGPPAAQPLLPRLQLLRQPVPAVRARQRSGGLLGMGQQLAKIGPHQLVQPLGRAQAGRALVLPAREQGGQLARAGVVALPVRGPGQASQAAEPTADQVAQQVRVGLVVALGEAAVAGQPRLHAIELFLADEGRISATRIHSSRGASTRLMAECLLGAVAERRSSVPRRCQRLP